MQKKAIKSCIFSDPAVNRYEEAISILESRYGSKNGVIRTHKHDLMNGKLNSDLIADFEIHANELKYFHSVLLHYKVNLEYFSGEVVKEILERRLSKICMQSLLIVYVLKMLLTH